MHDEVKVVIDNSKTVEANDTFSLFYGYKLYYDFSQTSISLLFSTLRISYTDKARELQLSCRTLKLHLRPRGLRADKGSVYSDWHQR